jgi:hypothetical protein
MSMLFVVPLAVAFIVLCVAMFFARRFVFAAVLFVLGFILACLVGLLIPLEKR